MCPIRAQCSGHEGPWRARHFETTETCLLVLHRSVDRTPVRTARSKYVLLDDLATLRELRFADRDRRQALPDRAKAREEIVRIRTQQVNVA